MSTRNTDVELPRFLFHSSAGYLSKCFFHVPEVVNITSSYRLTNDVTDRRKVSTAVIYVHVFSTKDEPSVFVSCVYVTHPCWWTVRKYHHDEDDAVLKYSVTTHSCPEAPKKEGRLMSYSLSVFQPHSLWTAT